MAPKSAKSSDEGYACTLKLPSLSTDETVTRLVHFVSLMYKVTQFVWLAVWEFHAAVLFEIECGRAWWGDLFANLESRLLRHPTNSSGIRHPTNSSPTKTFPIKSSLPSFLMVPVKSTIRNETKWLQHICAKCWTVSRVIGKHSEFARECPTNHGTSQR